MKRLGFSLITAAIALQSVALAHPRQEADIVDTAVKAGNFKTLASLLTKAGLVDTLKGAGPFTVLAPTDAAFAKVPKATLAKLSADPALLKKVLTYHVIPASAMAADLKNGMKYKTVEGENVVAHIKGKVVKLGGATVTMADVKASNGVIHAIDKVLIPPSGLKSASAAKMKKTKAATP